MDKGAALALAMVVLGVAAAVAISGTQKTVKVQDTLISRAEDKADTLLR